MRVDVRDMNIQRLIAFTTCFLVNEPGSEAFDLHACAGLLLNILHEGTLRTDDFGPNIEVP